MWLPESPVDKWTYDTARDVVVLHCAGVLPRGSVPASLLIDAAGFLVGVDLDPDGARLVAMLGPHEAVAKSIATTLLTSTGQVQIPNAKKNVRGHEPNPYR